MLRDITLGQYYQTDSVIHRLDPRVKLVATIAFIISLFLVDNVWGYIVAMVFLAACIKLSRVPFKFMVKGMRAILFLLLLTVAFNMFLTPGTPLVQIWKLTITKEGLRLAIMMAVRLTFLIIGSSIMTLTTTPNNLTDGMERSSDPSSAKQPCSTPLTTQRKWHVGTTGESKRLPLTDSRSTRAVPSREDKRKKTAVFLQEITRSIP